MLYSNRNALRWRYILIIVCSYLPVNHLLSEGAALLWTGRVKLLPTSQTTRSCVSLTAMHAECTVLLFFFLSCETRNRCIRTPLTSPSQFTFQLSLSIAFFGCYSQCTKQYWAFWEVHVTLIPFFLNWYLQFYWLPQDGEPVFFSIRSQFLIWNSQSDIVANALKNISS